MPTLLFLLLLLANQSLMAQDYSTLFKTGPDWTPIGTYEKGIQIYKKENNKDGIYSFRGMSVLDYPIEKVVALSADFDLVQEWTDSLQELTLLEQMAPDRWRFYSRFDVPLFFLSKRDFVFDIITKLEFNPKKLTVTYQSIDGIRKEKRGHVRGSLTGTTYRYTELVPGKRSFVDLEIHCDPKGAIPKFIVNYFQENWPLNTIRQLNKELAKEKHPVTPFVEDLLQDGRVELPPTNTARK